MPPLDLAALADAGLPTIEHDFRREVKSRTKTEVDGLEALLVETWERNSHDGRQLLLFVLNDDYLLVFRTGRSPDEDTLKAFESMRASLRLAVDDLPR